MNPSLPDTPTPIAAISDAQGNIESQAAASSTFASDLRLILAETRILDRDQLRAILSSGCDLLTPSEQWRGVKTSALIVNEDITKLLLVQIFPSERWLAPGGEIVAGEDPHHTALRHAREMTGVEAKPASAQSPDKIFHAEVATDFEGDQRLGAETSFLVFGHENNPIQKGPGIHDAKWVTILDMLDAEEAHLMGISTKAYWFGEHARMVRALKAG
ncbi:NUDIX domain-containing protein [Pseudomonas fluorescens]|uniref:NUDIX domain-containing protein n=1 Tax=Pseudomonas fluorescens TaxID=294 RepID=UPI001930E1C6|nr:NUDIX domain-containing protein [Pseudomonas fluorescens]MBD8088984.1 NUDIX domain-containing protein [Pseudomonas fluorescens]